MRSQTYWMIEGLSRDIKIGDVVVPRPVRVDRIPKDRKIKAQAVLYTGYGEPIILGSRGQVYANVNVKSREIRPGKLGRRLANALLEFGIINEAQHAGYTRLCDEAVAESERRGHAYEIERSAEALGIELTTGQKRKLKAILK